MVSIVFRTARSILRCYNQVPLKSFSYPKILPPKYQSRSFSVYEEIKSPNNKAIDVAEHSISPDRKHLSISWNSDTTGINKYYALWLRQQCQCEECFHSSSGQNLINPENLQPPIFLENVRIKDDSLSLTWKYEDGRSHQGFISLHWMYWLKKMPGSP
ncbi:hypothetical protein LOD99_10150 [Oopsacas minuta]|uniref:Gamma-butyrobetaine hydroxylase-like N-terminal domain-containing protein n=1 Tax=Oopsacas minuta TaxID=111878 RepID=A0AAV7KJ50_9METZ|nr:hypothetical protein LOD99_10150 [Oopsacas minuta]